LGHDPQPYFANSGQNPTKSYSLCIGGKFLCALQMEAQNAIDNGQLQTVLPAYQVKTLAIYGLYMSRERQPAALRAFLDTVQQQLLT
jgi:DNA-binding transcriptional LysR family regulator